MIPNISHDLVESLLNYIDSADDDESEREARAAGVEAMLYDGANEDEAAYIDKIIRDVKAGRRPKEEDPLNLPPLEEQPPPKKWSSIKIYDPARTGYMRSTREEGTGSELKAMRKDSMGTPLYDTGASLSQRADIKEKLKQLLRPKKV